MTSLHNPYFHKSKTGEQGLLDSLIKESIQIMGNQYYYLPRDMQREDLILNEDVISKFTLAVPIEMYLADAQGFTGDKEMFSKFGLTISNQYKLVVNKTRWETELKTLFDGIIGNGEADFTIDNYIRPREGDLIYDPMTKFLMEIKFVDHDEQFYALGKNYQYYLTCEAHQYQATDISTNIPDIDAFGLNYTKNYDSLLNEDATSLLFQDGTLITVEEFITDAVKTYGDDYVPLQGSIQFTVTDPFGG